MRNAVWDALHGFARSTPLNDVDVIWFGPGSDAAADRLLERELGRLCPGIGWSVKNQARMHQRNGDPPYIDSLDAMRAWPETATCVAARVSPAGAVALQAAFGFDDLIELKLRPTPREQQKGQAAFRQRVAGKGWLTTWPLLAIVTHLPPRDGVTAQSAPG